VEDVLEVIPFPRFFRVEEVQEVLNEVLVDVDLECLDFSGLVDNELLKEFLDSY